MLVSVPDDNVNKLSAGVELYVEDITVNVSTLSRNTNAVLELIPFESTPDALL